MFDKLVESTKQKPQGRNKFYMVTSLIYGAILSAVAVLTIIWFNPGMAEANSGIGTLLTPPPPPPPPPTAIAMVKPAPVEIWTPPIKPPETIADPTKVLPKPPSIKPGAVVVGAPGIGDYRETGTGVAGSQIGDPSEPPPPPPTPTPMPTPKATPTPAPTPETPKMVTVPSTILQGKAIRRVQPSYPIIAKQAKVYGSVPVQITISEEGRVIDASVVGGHPLLRDAARQAALQWAFSPTVLNGKNVKVSGVISFNFILN